MLLLGILLTFIILNKDNNITCKYEEKREQYTRNVVVNITFDGKLLNYSQSEIYNYKEGYMDILIDKYDNTKTYLEFVSKNTGVKTDITQDGYILKYDINTVLSKNKKVDYELLGIGELKKLNSKEDIINYYTELKYTCEK